MGHQGLKEAVTIPPSSFSLFPTLTSPSPFPTTSTPIPTPLNVFYYHLPTIRNPMLVFRSLISGYIVQSTSSTQQTSRSFLYRPPDYVQNSQHTFNLPVCSMSLSTPPDLYGHPNTLQIHLTLPAFDLPIRQGHLTLLRSPEMARNPFGFLTQIFKNWINKNCSKFESRNLMRTDRFFCLLEDSKIPYFSLQIAANITN